MGTVCLTHPYEANGSAITGAHLLFIFIRNRSPQFVESVQPSLVVSIDCFQKGGTVNCGRAKGQGPFHERVVKSAV